TTYNGGSFSCGGSYCFGTVFRMTPNGTITVLHSFVGGLSDGANPTGPLLVAPDGFLYGTTQFGGSNYFPGDGTVFRVSSTGAVTIFHFFDRFVDTSFPAGGLVQAPDGNLYGANLDHAIFRITAAG